jgi:deoxycytidine triphosphate deaminase
MLVDPKQYVSGVEADGTGYSIPVNAAAIRGYQGNPFVVTEETNLERETYELQLMIDPGDPKKEREIAHMFPGSYAFTSDVYVTVPKGHVAWLLPSAKLVAAGLSVSSALMGPGHKGLVEGVLRVDGGEAFIEPGQDIAELVIQKVED